MRLRLWIAFLLIQCQAWAQGGSVNLSVLSESLQKDLKSKFSFLQEEDVSRADLDTLIRYLVNQEQYETVRFQQETTAAGKKIYHLNVGRTRRISALRFKGASSISETELRNQLGIGEKAVFDQQTLIEGGERIRRIYRDRGFRNTTIDLEFARLSETEVAVDVQVKEGPQTLVSSVELKASNSEFKRLFERQLRRQLINEPLTEQLLVGVRKEMREQFSRRRFLKADLTGPEVSFNRDESQATLTFTVVNSDQYLIDFKGVLQKGRGSVENSLNLDTFFSTNPNLGPELATRVKNYYLSEGYSRVEVSGDETEGGKPFEKILVLDIREGPKVKIREINFIGRFSRPKQEYVDFLINHSTELIQDGYYNRDGIETGVKNLVIDRQNQGYLRAKVISLKTNYVGNKKDQIQITINLEEGPLTLLESLSFEGNSSFPEAILTGLIGLRTQEPLKLNQLEQGISKLKEFYYNNGFLEMSLVNEQEDLVRYNQDSTLAQVRFNILEGPKIVVGSILIEGNSLTKDYVILKELEFEPGQTLTPQLIEESARRLQRLGHFSSVDIKTLEEKTQISRRTVIVRVADRDPGLLTIGAGVNSELGVTFRGYTGVAYRNIFGTGRGTSARAEGNYNTTSVRYLEYRVNLSYLEPYLLNTRMNGRVNYTVSEYVADFKDRKGTQSKQNIWTLEQNLSSNVFLSYDVLNSNQLRDFPLDESNPNNLPRTDNLIVSTGPNVDIDFRDHPFNPTKGSFTRFNAEYGSPDLGSSRTIKYLRASASYTHYQSFGKAGWVWANSLRGGVLRNWSPLGGVPYDKKGFTLGGQSTIRGFQPDEAFPNRSDFISDTDTELLLSGEASMYLLKSEIRFPIWGNIGGAIFYDGGAVYVDEMNFRKNAVDSLSRVSFSDPYRDAAGVAFRYNTPVGAVSLELGYKLDRKEDRNENQWPIFFSIGTF
jgi:outer membrane protein insertion porin family